MDLSVAGAGFESSEELNPGDSVRFDIPLGISIRVRVVASFREGGKFRHSTEFAGMDDPFQYQVLSSHVLRQIGPLGREPLSADIFGA